MKEYDPKEKYAYYSQEIINAAQDCQKWQKTGERIVNRFLDKKRDIDQAVERPVSLNLFHSNIQTLQSMLYGSLPKVDVSRRYADPEDDVSRVAAEMMERLLNNDIADRPGHYNSVLRATLQDRLLPGLGCARVRYEVETESTSVEVMDPETGEFVVAEEERVISEDAPVDYFFWKDVLWGWARNWDEVPWVAFRSYLSKSEVTQRFGEKVAKRMDYKQQKTDEQAAKEDSAPSKAEIWEIWEKKGRKVCYLSLGYDQILDVKDDPLQLKGFYPCPPFLMANPTTTRYIPTPDFHLAADLYDEVDNLQTRISIITSAVKVVGLYDSSAAEIGRMFREGNIDNTLIPVENWALFGDKGGIARAIEWFPLQDVVTALDKLRQIRDETIQLLYQVTGMADILRGGDSGQYEAAGTAQLKAKFGSVRVQALQDEFADFASSIMELKAEVICRHFEPETIVNLSNIENSYDANMVPEAVEMLKNPELARLRIKIRPESVAMVDYAQLKQERTDYIMALSQFLQSSAPIMEQNQSATPFLLQLLQWGLAGFKGSSEIEGVIDRAVDAANQEMAQQQEQGPQPDPQMQLEQFKAQSDLQKIQAKAQADMQVKQATAQAEAEVAMQAHAARIAETEADLMSKVAGINAKMEADIATEMVRIQGNIDQSNAAAEAEIGRAVVNTELELQKEAEKSGLKMQEIVTATLAKIRESRVTGKSGD